MKMTSRAKRQHTIPIVHLKHFIGNNPAGQIWTYDGASGEMRSATPENTAVVGDFYSLEQPDGSINTEIEEALSKVESAAAEPYERLVAGAIPAGVQRGNFAMFLALMFVRTTAMRRIGGQMYGQFIQTMSYAYASNPKVFEGSMKRFELSSGQSFTPEQREDIRQFILDPDRYSMQIPKDRAMILLGSADKLAEILHAMKWSLVSPERGYFFTSDNPLVRVSRRTHHTARSDGGFKDKNAEVFFPLTPRAQLLLHWQGDAPDRGLLRRRLVDGSNAERAMTSEQYLFAHIRDERILRLAIKFRHSRPEIEMSGFGPPKFAKIEMPRRMKKKEV